MARFIPTIRINFRGKEAQEFEHDTLVGRWVRGSDLSLLTLSTALLVLGILFLNGINPLHADGNGWAPIVIGGIGLGLIGAKIGLRVLTRRLIPEDHLHDRLNVDYRKLNTMMREDAVQPRLILNGKRYYARTDFAEISTLLRASAAPQTGAETLLRVPREHSQPSAQNLLHPVINPPVTDTPTSTIKASIADISVAPNQLAPDQPQTIRNSTGL